MRLNQAFLVVFLNGQYALSLEIYLLGFSLLHKYVANVGLQQRKRSFANLKFFVLNRKSKLKSTIRRPKRLEIKLYWGNWQYTYIIKMSLHMDESQGLFKEKNEQTWRHFVIVKFVIVHIGFLSKSECGVLKTYTRKYSISLSRLWKILVARPRQYGRLQ